MSAAGRYHFVYFLVVIFFGSFYLVNLILAIVSMSYLEQQKKVEAENEEREKRKISYSDEVLPAQKSDKTSVRSKSESYCNIPIQNIKRFFFFLIFLYD